MNHADWRRIDPRTLLLVAVPSVLWLAIVIGFSRATDVEIGQVTQALAAPLIGTAVAVVRYVTGRYALADGALHWKVGLVVRKSTQIAVDRIQDVEVTRPLVARFLGLAALNVSSAGGAGEIKLVYLDRGAAELLSHHLQQLIGREPVASVVSPGETATELHRVRTDELAAWVGFRLWPLLGAAVASLAVLIVVDVAPVWFAMAPIIPLLGVALVKPVFDRWAMTVAMNPTTVFTKEGLTTTRRTTTKRDRVQVVVGYRLWLQGLFGREAVRYASADVTGNRNEGSVREEMALNVPTGSWVNFASTVAGRAVVGPDRLRAKPAALSTLVWWHTAVFGGAFALLAGTSGAVAGPGAAVAAFLGVLAVSFVVGGFIAVLRRRVEGWVVTPDDLLAVSGVIRRKSILLFATKMQAVEVLSGPLQRRLGLVTVVVDIAPPGHFNRVVVRDVTVAEGEELRSALTAAGLVPLPAGV